MSRSRSSVSRLHHRRVLPTLALVLASVAPLSAQERPPYELEQIVRLVESGLFSEDAILELARESCLAFGVDDRRQDRLRQAGASPELLEGLGGVCVRSVHPPATIEGLPPALELTVGARSSLEVRVLDVQGAPVTDAAVVWSSQDTAVAVVEPDGTVIGQRPGLTRVRARVGDEVDRSLAVRVVGPPVADAGTEPGGKSAATAALLGAVIPGAGEFYVGNHVKGAIVLLGATGALATGYLIQTRDTLGVTRTVSEECQGTACQFQVRTFTREQTSRRILLGAATAAAFWAFGLVDGILSAGSESSPSSVTTDGLGPGLSLQVAPPDGVVVQEDGAVDVTLIQARW